MRATVSFPYDIVHLPRHILYLEAMPEGSEHSYQNGFGGGLDRGDRGDRAGRGGTQTSAAAGDPIFDRVPPHDDDAEMAVLGGMLMSKDAIGEVSQTIDVTDFYQPKHQTIYNAIIDLFSASQPVDVVLVANQLVVPDVLRPLVGIVVAAEGDAASVRGQQFRPCKVTSRAHGFLPWRLAMRPRLHIGY